MSVRLEKTWQRYGLETTAALRDLAQIHADSHPGLVMLDDNQAIYEPQSYGQFFEDKHLEPSFLTDIATTTNPNFPKMLDQLRKQNDTLGHINILGEFLNRGHSGVVIGPHGDITDPAFIEVAVRALLHENKFQVDAGLIVNKIVGHLAYKLFEGADPLPAVDVMQMVGDVWMTYPPSARMRAKGLERRVTGTFNSYAKRRIDKRMGQGGYLLFLAASGETDKPLTEDPTTIRLAPVQGGTVDIMNSHIVLPVGIDLASSQLGLAGRPRTVGNQDTADEMMHEIAGWLNDNAAPITGKNYRYADAA